MDEKEALQIEFLELTGEEPDKRWSIETLEEKIQEVTSSESSELKQEIGVDYENEHPMSYSESPTQVFVFNYLVGDDNFKKYVNDYMHEHTHIKKEDDDINYYDWFFHQHLIDSFLNYARYLVKNKVDNPYIERLDLDEGVEADWFDIYSLIAKDNKGIRYAKFYNERG